MSGKSNYIHHVNMGYQDGRPPKSWCGSKEMPFFVDATHAALNGLAGGLLVACPDCVREITKALRSGHEDAPEPATVAVDAGALAELREAVGHLDKQPVYLLSVSRARAEVLVMEAARRLLAGGE